jgi:twinkle protein
MLSDRVQSVCEYLLPGGKKEGQEWRAGSVQGDKGQSLGVHLSGVKAGVWADFNTGERGDLIDLWMVTHGLSVVSALKEIRDWLGIETPKPHRDPRKAYVRPPRPQCAVPQGHVRDYLCEIRNIPGHILDLYKVGEHDDTMFFPFLLPNGELAMAKARKAIDGAKPKPTTKNCEPILFGWQAINDNAREVVLTEGEIDCLSWSAYEYQALSVPFGGGGAGKQQWIENDFERMERFERIYLAMDMDKPGDEAAAEIADRLGRHRCFRVKMPFKDGNKCLMEGIPKAVMDATIAEAVSLDPEGLRRASDFTDAVTKLFWPDADERTGYQTPYAKLGRKLLFRPGEVSLWSGATGAGKSQVLSDCIVDWVHQGSRVCISSLEMRPEQTLKRMCRQVTGIAEPTKKAIASSLTWLDRGILLYDMVGKASTKDIISIFDYACSRYGCDQFVIDSLMRLGIAGDDYNGQERAVFDIVNWSVSRNVHLHLVAHSRKGAADGGSPETEDVKGAMEIGANAFNIITIWRDRKSEDAIQKFEQSGKHDDADKLRGKPGVILNVAKQRNGDFEGKVGLWFNTETYRYTSSEDRKFLSRGYKYD